MIYPFLRPREVHGEAVILIGYRLYPYVRVALHPRLTLLAGGNGAGKTTLLDALQTILIADQRYLHLNVAAGQNDRDLGGQLQDRVAWALLQLQGHPQVSAIGVLLTRRPAVQYVDLKPFALVGTAPLEDFFLDRTESRITQDLRALNRKLAAAGNGARVKEFGTLNDYHRFLFDEGLFPLDLSKGGKRQFSLLWRQATQPHLGELNHFLQKTLCHEPDQRVTFDDVEKLMQERLHTERQLQRLGELKQLSTELRDRALELDRHRRRYLAINLGQSKEREESLAQAIEEGEKRFRQLDQRMQTLNGELDAVRSQFDELGRERDKYLREQGDWSRKHKHHREYVAQGEVIQQLQDELTWLQQDVFPLEAEIQEVREQKEQLQQELGKASTELAQSKTRAADLQGRAKKWLEFQNDLQQAGYLLGTEIRSAAELETAWSEILEQKSSGGEIKSLKQLIQHWKSRAAAYAAARATAGRMIELWPDYFAERELDRALLDNAQNELRQREKQIALTRERLQEETRNLRKLITELSKGRLPMPNGADELVEQGLAQPYVRHFDHLDLATARTCQDTVGPLARAIEPIRGGTPESAATPPSEPAGDSPASETSREELQQKLAGLARGKEAFWLVLKPEAWRDLQVFYRGDQGTIAGFGPIAWYTPHGPVWIGAAARREQTDLAQQRMVAIEAETAALVAQEKQIAQRLRAIQDFLPKLEGLADAEAAAKTAQLSEMVREMEQEAPQVERTYRILQSLLQRSELFHSSDSPEELNRLQEVVRTGNERCRTLEIQLKELKSKDSDRSTRLASLHTKLQSLRRQLDKAHTLRSRLEEEEPPEVLAGQVDFGRADELTRRIQELDEEKAKLQNALFVGERKSGELQNRYRTQSQTLAQQRYELTRVLQDHERAVALWTEAYPKEEPHYLFGLSREDREQHKALWSNQLQGLSSRLEEVGQVYGLHIPAARQPDQAVPQVLQMLLPPGVALEQLEDQYVRLQSELELVERKIKSHVEEVRSSVDREINRLRVHILKVNRILATLSFGHIRKIHLELDELPPYFALKKLESLLSAINRDGALSLRAFVDQLRSFILKESNTSLSEEQIADYRSYIRLRRVIVDNNEQVRQGGLSSGETLGVNLALCLSVLFFLGREQGDNTDSGMLLLALDEAERLDAKAMETIRTLLDEVRCQLMVAMPRPIDIPDSICHLLTPLSQGVTHVHLYRNADSAATPVDGPPMIP